MGNPNIRTFQAGNHQDGGLKYKSEPRVKVGIVSGSSLHFSLNAPYAVNGESVTGGQEVKCENQKLLWRGNLYSELLFCSDHSDASFALEDVTIGINFHWQRRETQVFPGCLRLIVDGNDVCAINEVPVEDYLRSVISSEMSGTSSLEMLKAHAVISRSWLLAQMENRCMDKTAVTQPSFVQTDDEIIRWYDREDHSLFDVCADDHCQRYQGISKATSPQVAEAIRQTRGMLLMADGEICDARFSKCCGGVMEEFQHCWEDSPKSYLKALADNPSQQDFPDLTIEANAEQWIRTAPPSFCNTKDKTVLSQVLNNYDQETTDFYRWQVVYSREELSRLITEKLSIDFGAIIDLIPMERGKSGRITKLKIVGTRKTLTIGKELEVRRALSKTHLYSSAFVVERQGVDVEGVPATFVLYGAGWGHGVGLCQIGAAMMGEQGYHFDEMLHHYYPGAEIVRAYD